MLKIVPYLFLILLLLPKSVFAESSVRILNNVADSNNSVTLNSNSSNVQQTSGNIQNRTDIVIENNGERKEYHGTDGKVELKSSDGKSSVSVNSNGGDSNTTHITSSANSTANITINSKTTDSSASASPVATVAGVFKAEQDIKAKAGLWAYLKRELELLFNLFRKL